MSMDFEERPIYRGQVVTGGLNTSEQALQQYEAACMEVYGAEAIFGDEYTTRTPSRTED